LRKADESRGLLNADVENRDVSNSVSGERKTDETNMMVSYYEQIVNERRAGFWGRCMEIIYQVCTILFSLLRITYLCVLCCTRSFANSMAPLFGMCHTKI
jgi:hypothetical protein